MLLHKEDISFEEFYKFWVTGGDISKNRLRNLISAYYIYKQSRDNLFLNLKTDYDNLFLKGRFHFY
jgi:hypothetical protein